MITEIIIFNKYIYIQYMYIYTCKSIFQKYTYFNIIDFFKTLNGNYIYVFFKCVHVFVRCLNFLIT